MRLTLWVPGLLLPDEIRADTLFDLAAPALSRLLGHARRETLRGDWVAIAFGVHSPLPVAALRKLGAGEAAEGEWLCLDPVHWQVTREGVTLADPDGLHLDAAEAAALIAVLQPLFADWGTLSATRSDHWSLNLRRPLALNTRPLPEAIGQPVDPHLPAGPDGKAWRTLLAEAQTVLHAHPVNRARDDQNRPTVNCLWPWGQGALPQAGRTDFTSVWSADPILAGLCALTGAPRSTTPEFFATGSGNIFCCVEALAAPARALDALAWRTALLEFEEHWLAPALAALRKGACTELRLIGAQLTGKANAAEFVMKRSDQLRFWRRPRPLTELA